MSVVHCCEQPIEAHRENGMKQPNFIRKLAVGTAQFGMNYGISNEQGQTEQHEVNRIVQMLWKEGVRLFDTAPVYGNSESVLGRVLSSNIKREARFASMPVKVITKSVHFQQDCISERDLEAFDKTFEHSLARLQCDSVEALLVHHGQDLKKAGADRLWDRMSVLKSKGKVKKVGLSVYDVEEVERTVGTYPIDIVQLPLNLCDQRFLTSGCIDQLKRLGIEVHSRSAFLQGLLLMTPNTLPDYFKPYQPMLQQWWSALSEQGVTPFSAALSFVLSQPGIDAVVVGASSMMQWREIIDVAIGGGDAINSKSALPLCSDAALINPSLWPNG